MVKQLKEIFIHIIEITNENIQATIASTVCFFWLIAKIITWKLWVTDRIFPLVPPMDFLEVPAIIHWILFVSSIILLLSIIAWPSNKKLLLSLLIIELITCLFDQNRWQPWEYQYIFTLFILCINQQKHIAKVYIFLLSLIYILSGINKFHPNFLWMVWDNMILQGFFKMPKNMVHQPWLYKSGYILALLEFCGGVALLHAPFRKKAAILLIAMHLFIFLFVGPLGLGYNKAIWPWNICMVVQLVVVAWPNKQGILHTPTLFYGWNKLVFLCWGILPLLSFWGLWDNYLSSNLYSGTLPKAVVCVADTSTTTKINKYFNKKDALHKCDGKALINLQTWSMTEMEAPVYPQMRVYKKIEKYWLKKYPNSQPSFIYY
jgi:hypothetical protein